MLKKNMRKRLLAGALATIMALTMCPTWALAVDGITTLPAPEGQTPVVDSTPTGDTIQTPDAGTQGQTEPKDTEQAGQLENQDPAQAPSGGTNIEGTGNNSNSNENDSQNNDAVSNSPANEIAPTSGNSDNAVDVYANKVTTIQAEYWITNRQANGSDGVSMTIDETVVGNGKAVTDFAPAERKATADADYNTVFWQARVLGWGKHQTTTADDDKTAEGTEITRIRYNDGQLEYQAKDSPKWTAFTDYDQLVFYYLIRTGYTQMVQIDVSDWTLPKEAEPKGDKNHRSVTYQVIVEKDGERTVTDNKKFWYNKAFTVSSVRVRQTETKDYTIDRVEFDPSNLGEAVKVNGEHQFSMNLKQVTDSSRNATVKIYVQPTVEKVTLSYELNGGTYKSAKGTYTVGKVYPYQEVTTPTVEKDNYTFEGWYTDSTFTHKWAEDDVMPNKDLTLYAKWVQYTVTYQYDNGTPDTVDICKSGTTVAVKSEQPTKDGHKFVGWENISNNATGYEKGSFTMPKADVVFKAKYEKIPDPKNYKYIIKNHFYDSEGKEIVNLVPDVTGTKAASTSVKDLYAAEEKNQTVAGKTYIYVASKTTIDPKITELNQNVTINLHYYLDVKGDREKPEEKGDGIPDAWEYRLTFKVENGNWNNDTNAGVIVYVPFKDANGNAIEKVVIPDGIPTAGEKPAAGYCEGKWDTTPVVGATVANDTVFTYTYAPVPKYAYVIEHYQYNPTTGKYEIVETDTETGTAALNETITAKSKGYTGYVLNPYADGYRASGTVTKNADGTVPKLTLKLFYDPDTKGDSKDPENKGDGIPDRYQYKVTEKVVNGKWDSHTKDNKDIIFYVSTINMGTGKTVQPKLAAADIAQAGNSPDAGYRAAGSWNVEPKVDMEIKADTVFTYTYARRSSSGGGGGGGRKPTVTIPDDVPTGLNGDDHYAYIVGYPDSTVRPQNGITRAEVATIFFRLLTDETRNANSTKTNSYSDVAEGAWYNHAVSTLSAMGIVKGDSQGKFNPNAPITRAEFAAIAARFDDKANTTAVDFSDIASHWAKDEISAAANNGWINGYTDGTFRPNNKITRAEAMTLVNRVLKRLPETAEDLHNDMIKWSDNSDTSAWYYLAVQEATNSHYYDIKENKHEKWSKLRETRDWTELEK